jgi:hypothetical protein
MNRKVFLPALCFLISQAVMAQSEIKTSLFGDLRMREESVENESATGKNQYDQLRLRARLGIKAQINDTLKTEFRMATGSGGTSTNQTLSDTKNYDFKLDRAFFTYTPHETCYLKGGRTDNPFILVGDNSLLFDSDLNFDGASTGYSFKTESMSFHFILSHAVLRETTATNVDSKLNSAEFAMRFGGDMHSFLLTIAEHSFTNLKNNSAIVGFSGNSSSGAAYLYNYDVTSIGFEYGLKIGIPLTFYAEMAKNNRTQHEDMASIYGIKINKLKKKADWMLSIDSREVESDSTLGSISDSDSFGGGTNGRSLNTTIGYSLDDNAILMATYLLGETGIGPAETARDRNRTQVDLSIKF